MKSKKKVEPYEELEEIDSPPFSSIYVQDYVDEIERRFEEQAKRKGRVSSKWKEEINKLIEDCEKLRRKYLPKSDKSRIYDRVK